MFWRTPLTIIRGVTTKMVRQNSRLLVVCGPSGSGKSTLLRKLFDEYPDKFGFSVSHTTRSPRRFEVDGQHYHFTTKDQMQAAIDRGEFLEHAIFSNNMYGTSLKAVQNVQKSGKICVLDIDMQGVIQIKKVANLKPVGVFVKPPSIGELEIRLRRRNSESEDNLRARLNVAQQEINYGETPGNFDCIIINESLDKAYNVFKEFVLKSFETVEN
ncbi:uncharacterized protein LOC132938432 isoform X2 [Metopolophium dirhodum]|uniref:uncharacterized protein LOC132938432 isoform X2 n=1 Tax=Metopolophium dirhodum TaxID=44670 RepID=UPI00299079E3|nr:uncharacterized protein LOC132938432 isoform X2 [Metopolophium dirhodum]